MNNLPLISVLLPAYNAEKYIAKAIESILTQTYTNFEFIIINDGSNDSTKEIIQSFKDPRIKYVENEKNSGLIYTLNRGLALATGKYIARMDADDISLPNRLEKQVEVMESFHNIIVCGGQISLIGESKNKTIKRPTANKKIKNYMFFSCPFAHPTVMLRKQVLDEHKIEYDPYFKYAEDYKLWCDLADKGEFYNLTDVVLLYRISPTQITQVSRKQQISTARRVRRSYLTRVYPSLKLGDSITINDIKKYKNLINNWSVIELLYLSCDVYNLSFLFYFISSFDWFKISFEGNLRIIRRVIFGPNTLL